MIKIYNDDVFSRLKKIKDSSVDLVICDPPYFRYINEKWDNQWSSEKEYLKWLEKLLIELNRVMKKHGSLYLFCSPRIDYKIAQMIDTHFNLLNNICWHKQSGRYQYANKQVMRSYFPASENILFAEKKISALEKDRLRTKYLISIINYFIDALEASTITKKDIDVHFNKFMSRHYFSKSQFRLMNKDVYLEIKELLLEHNSDLNRDYEDVHNEYRQRLQAYHADVNKRAFKASGAREFTNVWRYKLDTKDRTHPCQKPIQMMLDILETSSHASDTVLDPFAGSAVVALACKQLNRKYIGIEKDIDYYNAANKKLFKITA